MRTHKPTFLLLVVAQLVGCGDRMVGFPDADLTPPQVTSITPSDGDTQVALNSALIATFSEPMDPDSITPQTFTLQSGDRPVAATVIYTGATAVVLPTEDLDRETEYTATISQDAVDLAGNHLQADYIWDFTTGRTIDDTAPYVVATWPLDEQIDVSVNTSVIGTFNESVDPTSLDASSFYVSKDETRVLGTVYVNGTNAMFDPDDKLEVNTRYTATITTDVEDLAGIPMAEDYSWDFTIGASGDVTPPTVTLANPSDGSVDVSQNSNLNAVFSEAMDPTTISESTFNVTGPDHDVVLGAVDYFVFSPIAQFDPINPFAAEGDYTATITTGVRDVAGNAMAEDYVWHFTVAAAPDNTAPFVVITEPVDHATGVALDTTIRAAFSETLDPLTVTDASFSVRGPGIVLVPGTVYYNGGLVAQFIPDDALLPLTTYTAAITTDVTDLAGNPMASDYSWTFATTPPPDSTAPTVVLTIPDDFETDVLVDADVTAAFSEAMDPLTVTPSSFLLVDPTSQPVLGVVRYDVTSRSMTFTPAADFEFNGIYTATATTDLTDLAGNPLDDDYVWTFSTENDDYAVNPIDLGSLDTFAIVSGVGLTNSNTSGTTIINGDVGLAPTGTCMGDGVPCTLLNPVINGTLHINDAEAMAADADLSLAFTDGMGRPTGPIVSDLAGMTLAPGVYTSASTMSVGVGGTVVLDGQGDVNAVWIFQVGSSLTVNNDALVLMMNGARAENVFWVVGASSTLGSDVSFQGSILAGMSNSVGTDSVVVGRLFSDNGAVTLLSNNITIPPN